MIIFWGIVGVIISIYEGIKINKEAEKTMHMTESEKHNYYGRKICGWRWDSDGQKDQ